MDAETLARLREKLARLAARDPDLDVFGSTGHRYQLAPPLPAAELAAWEARLGVRLPDEYRAFVAEVGASGAGPSYGLYTIAEIDQELDDPTPAGHSAGQPFPLTQADADRVHELRQHKATEWAFHDAPFPLPGCLPICHHGCAWYTVLVVTGPLRGCLWHAGEGWLLDRDAAGQPLGFLAWYERWLDGWLVSPDIPNRRKVVFGLERALALKVPDTVGKLWMHNADHPVVPEAIGQLTHLRALSLYASKVERLPDALGALSELEELELGRNPLAELPAGLRALTRLTSFDAMACPNLPAAHVIERLDGAALSKLRIGGGAPCRELPERLSTFTALTTLELSDLGLTALPSLAALTRLEQLNLGGNRLTRLPGVEALTALRRLHLQGNPLTELPDLSGAGELMMLDLGGTSLTALPPWLARLGKLTGLYLADLPALELEQACRQLAGRALRTLSLGGPTLRRLPETLADVTSLSCVIIADSPALDFEAACAVLARLPGLIDLRLPRNGLTAVPAGLLALAPTLEQLRLDDNPIAEVPRALGGFARLKGLDLGGTKVTMLPREVARLPFSFHRFPPDMQRET